MSAFPGRRRCLAIMLVLYAIAIPAGFASAASQADSPDGYSHRIAVGVSGRQAVVQLPLPRAVYLEAHSSDLRDLRLFDAAGTPMPFALVERMQQERVTRSTAPVAIFPVHAPAEDARKPQDGLQIRTREDGAVISVTAPSARRPGDVLSTLVLDLQPAGQATKAAAATDTAAVAALTLAPPAGADNYNARVVLEASDDLQRWTPVTEAALSWMVNSEGARVRKDRIEFAPRAFRYARIAWLEGAPAVFAGITADHVSRVRLPLQWEGVLLQSSPGQQGKDLAYTAPLAIPVESVGLVFQAENVVLPATLGLERPAGEGGPDLAPLASATFYQLTQNGRRRVSGDIAVPLTHASRWLLRPKAALPERPALRLRWQAATLVFMAGGRAPYTLAFGRDGAQPVYLPLVQVAPGFSQDELEGLEQASAGPPLRQHAGGKEDAGAGVTGLLRQRGFWLWALLLCGVAALAAMAWRLARQLKDGSSGQPPA